MKTFIMPKTVEEYILRNDPCTVSIILFDRFEFVTSKYRQIGGQRGGVA